MKTVDDIRIFELSRNIRWSQEQLDQIEAAYQMSIPNTKLFYPEPFIAAPSFVHNDIWYMHILVYWYWLWFIFLFIIVFFLLTFTSCLRWCNPRIEPKRETRGVSRSKCGDLVTATIPVTWAISIIISETTDAIDYYDGFKTTELIIGIRAYQWGWEYYYPKDIDTNYSLKPSYSEFLGNSLKYNKTSELKLNKNSMFNFLKKDKKDDNTALSTLLLLPTSSNTNLINNSALGKNTLNLDNSFSSITKYVKSPLLLTFQDLDKNSYISCSQYLLNDQNNFNAFNFKSLKSYNLLSTKSYLNSYETLFDLKTVFKLNNKFYGENKKYESLNNFNFNLNTLNNSLLLNNFYLSFFYLNDKLSEKWALRSLSLVNKFKYDRLLESINGYQSNFNYNIFYKNLTNLKINNYSNFIFFKKSKINNIDSSDAFLIKNINKKRLLDYHFVNNLSPISIKKKNIQFWDTINMKSSTNITPLISNNMFLSKFFAPNNFIKSSDEYINPTSIDPTNNYGSYLWSTKYALGNKFMGITSSLNFLNFYKNNLINNIILYPDYDFLNKDFIKVLENYLWYSYYDDFILEDYFILNDLNKAISKEEQKFNSFDFSKIYSEIKLDNEDEFDLINKFFFKNISFIKILNKSNLFLNNSPLLINTENFLAPNYNFFFINYLFNNSINNSYWLKASELLFFNNFNKNIIFNFIKYFNVYSSLNYINYYKINMVDQYFIKNNLLNKNKFFINLFLKSQNTNLRSSGSELIADYKSLQKVFKLRFDDLRSNTSNINLSSSFNKQNDLVSSLPQFSKILVKNSDSFFFIKSFKLNNLLFKLNKTNYLYNLINNYSYTFPFLYAQQSDQIRNIWFDWFSRWSKYEVQQASLAKLGLYGMPKFAKIFEYGASNSGYTNNENYLSKLSMIRKNYFSTTRFSPIFSNRINNFNKNYWVFKLNLLADKNNTYFFLTSNFKNWFKFNKLDYSLSQTLINLESGFNKYGHNYFKLYSLNSSFSENYALLGDILVKREYLIKNYFILNNKQPTLSNYYYSNLNNYLFKELINIYEIQSLSSSLINFSDNKVLSNQYKPLRRGISNMIRIQASNIIALPVELRIQVLASSRDIIHSWAIPSAGIKLDCIPGYSSHKILFFLLSGIYWGQCMEICGRYHHWMPIIVYFMKRDLFFLWCTHFVLNDKQNYVNKYSYSSNNYKIKPVSFKKENLIYFN